MTEQWSLFLSISERRWADEALRLLCEVGTVLSDSHEHEAALTRLAGLLVGSVADVCLVDVIARDGLPVRLAAVHRGADLGRRAWELRRFPPDPDDAGDPIVRVMRTGAPLLVPEVERSWLDANVGEAEHRQILQGLQLRSLLAVPLITRERVLGAITLISVDPSRCYGADDLMLAEELARRAAFMVEHARLREEAQEASRVAAEFLGAMTHEFRTPVHIVSMFTELLLLGVPEPVPSAARAHAEHIRTAVKHLDGLVTQVLTFARLEAAGETARNEAVDLAALARETAALIEPLAQQKGLGFGVDLPEDGAVARTDPNKLRQVLFNLLGNAVKFTESGEVRLVVRVGAGRATFEVRDTGIGIAPEHQERIFEPFWQADRESVPGSKGTGLGLGIVKRLVGLLCGDVTIESTPGVGSVFRVILPLGSEQT